MSTPLLLAVGHPHGLQDSTCPGTVAHVCVASRGGTDHRGLSRRSSPENEPSSISDLLPLLRTILGWTVCSGNELEGKAQAAAHHPLDLQQHVHAHGRLLSHLSPPTSLRLHPLLTVLCSFVFSTCTSSPFVLVALETAVHHVV